MTITPKKYVILTRFSYSEPGYSTSEVVPFQTTCTLDELPAAYRAWIKEAAAEESVDDYYGRKHIVGAFEAVSLPTDILTSAITTAYAEVRAEEEESKRAEDAAEEIENQRRVTEATPVVSKADRLAALEAEIAAIRKELDEQGVEP